MMATYSLSWFLAAALSWFSWIPGGLCIEVTTPAAGDHMIAER